MVSNKKIFQDFYYLSLCKTRDPQSGTIFWCHGYNLNNLGRGPLDEPTYQIW